MNTVLTNVREFIHEYGWLCTIAVLLILLDFVLVWSVPLPAALQQKSWFPVLQWVLPWAIPLLSCFLVALGVILRRKSRHLQLIAWNGFNEPEIVKSYRGPRLDILEYVRGIDRVTHLRYGKSLFDVLISDVEFLTRHHDPHNLLFLDKLDYEDFWDLIPPELRFRVEAAGRCLGIPVRCGLNDIVVNSRGFEKALSKPPTKSGLSYRELSLSTIVNNTDIRIGLWNWYLPTLGVLLLTEGVALNRVWDQKAVTVKAITDFIVQHKHRFLLFDQPGDATRFLKANQVWTVLGAGGWLIPANAAERGNLIALVPNEGVLMWVECAAIIDNREAHQAFSKDLIKHLLQPSTQHLLAERHAYRACPVTVSAIRDLSKDMDWVQTFNIDRIFDFDSTKNLPLKDKVVLRELPKDEWRNWESCWETVDAAVDHA